MRIAIAGAGAMGSRFALMLKKTDNELILIDQWKEHVEKIRHSGLKADFNGKEVIENFDIFTPEELTDQHQAIDLVIVFTKSNQLEKMFQAITPLLTENTHVLSLLNGLGHTEVLEKFVPKKNILVGVTMWSAGLLGPGEVVLTGSGSILLQNIAPQGESFAKKVVQVFNEGNLFASYSENVTYSIWEKACVNGTLNALCTLLECNIGDLGKLPTTHEMIKNILAEFALVAEKENVSLNQEEVFQKIIATFDPSVAGDHFPSMYQDLILHHRKTEIDYINGAVMKMGEKYHLPVPYCTLLTQLIHVKEALLMDEAIKN